MQTVLDFFMVMLFGKESMRGYYKPISKNRQNKKYVFASVFPSYEIMEVVLGEEEKKGKEDEV